MTLINGPNDPKFNCGGFSSLQRRKMTCMKDVKLQLLLRPVGSVSMDNH